MCAVTVDVGGSEAKLRVKPQNTVALAGTRVVLRCATEQQGDGDKITWTFATKNPTCRSKRDHCDLVIDEVQPSDAGAYECSVGNSKIAQASLIVIGKYTRIDLPNIQCSFNIALLTRAFTVYVTFMCENK